MATSVVSLHCILGFGKDSSAAKTERAIDRPEDHGAEREARVLVIRRNS